MTKFNLLSSKRKRNRCVNRVGVSSEIVHFLHIQQWLHLKHITHRAKYRTAHHSTQIQPWLHPLHHPPPLPLCANSGAFQKFKCVGGGGGNFRFLWVPFPTSPSLCELTQGRNQYSKFVLCKIFYSYHIGKQPIKKPIEQNNQTII